MDSQHNSYNAYSCPYACRPFLALFLSHTHPKKLVSPEQGVWVLATVMSGSFLCWLVFHFSWVGRKEEEEKRGEKTVDLSWVKSTIVKAVKGDKHFVLIMPTFFFDLFVCM